MLLKRTIWLVHCATPLGQITTPLTCPAELDHRMSSGVATCAQNKDWEVTVWVVLQSFCGWYSVKRYTCVLRQPCVLSTHFCFLFFFQISQAQHFILRNRLRETDTRRRTDFGLVFKVAFKEFENKNKLVLKATTCRF